MLRAATYVLRRWCQGKPPSPPPLPALSSQWWSDDRSQHNIDDGSHTHTLARAFKRKDVIYLLLARSLSLSVRLLRTPTQTQRRSSPLSSFPVVSSTSGRVSAAVAHFLLRETKLDPADFGPSWAISGRGLCEKVRRKWVFRGLRAFPVGFGVFCVVYGGFFSLPPMGVAIQQHSVTYGLSCFPPPEIGRKSTQSVVRIFRSPKCSWLGGVQRADLFLLSVFLKGGSKQVWFAKKKTKKKKQQRERLRIWRARPSSGCRRSRRGSPCSECGTCEDTQLAFSGAISRRNQRKLVKCGGHEVPGWPNRRRKRKIRSRSVAYPRRQPVEKKLDPKCGVWVSYLHTTPWSGYLLSQGTVQARCANSEWVRWGESELGAASESGARRRHCSRLVAPTTNSYW